MEETVKKTGSGAEDAVVGAGIGSHVLVPRTETNPSLCLLATGFSYNAQARRRQAQLLVELLPKVRDIRRIGAAALDICRVAEGTVDAYYEHGIKAWDCAAATIIAREAGVVVRHPGMDSYGTEGKLFFAAQPSIEPALWTLLESLGVDRNMVGEVRR